MVRDNHFGVPQSDVAAWESVLDLMLQELELSEVLRHSGLIEVFEAAGLGLTTVGVYRLAFGSNLKQQALLRPPGSSGLSSSRRCGGSESMPRTSDRSFPAGWAGSAASAREYDDD